MRIRFNPVFVVTVAASFLSGCSQSPVSWWRSVNRKAKELHSLDSRYEALKKEHERLKKEYFELEHRAIELRAKMDSQELGEKSLKASGTLGGRSLSSIHYQVPKGLKAEDIHALAIEHFTEERFAQAVVTFEDLFKRPDGGVIGDAAAHYTAGGAWFKLGNILKAREHFEEARKTATGEQKEKIHKKVDLWMRAIDRKKQGGGTLGG